MTGRALPTYLVQITGPPIESLGPTGGAANHFWNVIVNAITERAMSGFTYD
jgi:hypothetical protein